MSHEVKRLSKSLLDKPLLISVDKFQEISEFLDDRNNGNYEDTYKAAVEANLLNSKRPVLEYNKESRSSVGVLDIVGNLTYKKTGWEALCGGCSYTQLLADMDTFCEDESIKDILMRVDSGGGEAYSCFYTSKLLREKADKAGKRLIAYIDGISASAAYALTCAAHEVVIRKPAQAGSIGVLVQLLDNSKALEKAGYKRVFVTAGASKIPYNEDMSFKEEFLSDLQERVDELYIEFVDHVASMREISSESVRNTEAKVFNSKKCLELGLVDSIMEPDAFYEYLGADEFVTAQQLRHHNEKDEDKEEMNVVQTTTTLNNEETTLMSDTNITPEMLAELQAQLEAQSAQLAAYQAKETEAAKAALSAELDNISFLADCKDSVLDFMMSADESHKTLMNTVIEAAKAENLKVTEEAASMVAEKEKELTAMEEAVTEANEKVAKAEADVVKVKEEFGKQESLEGEPKGKTVDTEASHGQARTQQLQALVKEKLATK